MMRAILNSNILSLAILYSAILIFSFKLTHTCQDWFPPFSQNISLIHSDSTWWWQPSWLPPCWIQTLPSWIQTPCYLLSDWHKNTLIPLWLWLKLIQSDSTHSFSLNLMMAANLNSATLNLAILDSAILVFSFKLTHTCQDWFPPFAQKIFTHSFWLNFMIAAILNSAILNLATFYSAILIFSFKLIHTCQDWFPPFSQNISLIHSDSTWWWQPSWILPCWIERLPSWIQTPCYLLSDSLKNTLIPLWLWLKLIQSDSNSFNLT